MSDGTIRIIVLPSNNGIMIIIREIPAVLVVFVTITG
uniref:Uncharacterized protein n=1 Tax=virus sp. ctkyY8 TaxID=2827995 RepID=A0A8S5REK0_9VIRU|nr:MAG TPA: hypothetical protein [virus sp. ctkyY8]